MTIQKSYIASIRFMLLEIPNLIKQPKDIKAEVGDQELES